MIYLTILENINIKIDTPLDILTNIELLILKNIAYRVMLRVPATVASAEKVFQMSV